MKQFQREQNKGRIRIENNIIEILEISARALQIVLISRYKFLPIARNFNYLLTNNGKFDANEIGISETKTLILIKLLARL